MKSLLSLFLLVLFHSAAAFAVDWDCEVLAPEQKIETDPQSGAKLIFVTTNPAVDTNFYFHKRCFMLNNRMMLFNSERFGRTEVMAWLEDTGELVRLNQAQDPAAGSPVASIKGDRLYVFKEKGIYAWQMEVTTLPKTAVHVRETRVVELPPDAQERSFIVENCDGTVIAQAYKLGEDHYIGFYSLQDGRALPPAKLDFKPDHMQFHWDRPDLLAFSRVYESDMAPLNPEEPPHARFWFMNVNTRVAVPAFYQVPGEIVTHECWWVHDQITFIGGHHHDGDREEGNVKVLDLKTGDIRIIGAGAWMDDATAQQLSQVNWWHASGSPDGKWVVADNWHGTVALFDAKTTEKRVLTTGHRVYGGGGSHLHAGWDLTGSRVEFTSHKLGDPNVCIGIVPERWKGVPSSASVPAIP